MAERAEHWEQVYATRSPAELSWYQQEPAASLRLVEAVATDASVAVIDVGAGESALVDRLLADGFTDLTVLDVSGRALDDVAARLGDRAREVTFVRHDALTWEPGRQYGVWHDRAVFHFLTARPDRDRYADLASRAIRPGGWLVVATFAEDGPTHCSGLPVCRYSAQQLSEVFGEHFALVRHEREEHATPTGAVQPFSWAVLRRN